MTLSQEEKEAVEAIHVGYNLECVIWINTKSHTDMRGINTIQCSLNKKFMFAKFKMATNPR